MDTNKHEIDKLIQQGESLSLEFKSDLKCLPDRDLVAVVVSLANTDGGNLLLGVEDDGSSYRLACQPSECVGHSFADRQQNQSRHICSHRAV